MPPSPPPEKNTSPTKVKTSGPLLPSCLSPIIDDEEQGENKESNDDELDLLAMDDAGGDDLVSFHPLALCVESQRNDTDVWDLDNNDNILRNNLILPSLITTVPSN